MYIPTLRVSSIGGSEARAPLFLNTVRITGGESYDPYSAPPIVGTLNLPELSPRVVSSTQVQICVCCQIFLSLQNCYSKRSKLILPHCCPLVALIWLLLYPVGFFAVPSCCFPQRNMEQIASKSPFIPLLVSQLDLKYHEGVRHSKNINPDELSKNTVKLCVRLHT